MITQVPSFAHYDQMGGYYHDDIDGRDFVLEYFSNNFHKVEGIMTPEELQICEQYFEDWSDKEKEALMLLLCEQYLEEIGL